MSYDQELLSPQWKAKRNEILIRDKHRCKSCGASETVLQVHHRVYIIGCKPWAIPNDALVTLCRDCHKQEERFKKEIEIIIADYSYGGYSFKEIFRHLEKLSSNG